MTVAELIESLKRFPADMPVVTDGYEGGYDDADEPMKIDVGWNLNTTVSYFGRHSEINPWDENPKGKRTVVKI